MCVYNRSLPLLPHMSKIKTLCFSRIYHPTSALSSLVSFPTPIPATPHQKERHHQGKGNELLMSLAGREALGTASIRIRARLGGLLKFYSREAAGFC